PVEPMADLKGLRVLVAEDNMVNQMLMRTALKRMNCSVTVANNGVEVLNRLQESTFDVCFMDMHMPEMNGVEATRRIRNDLKLNLPIFALTAAVLEEDRKACLDAGMDDFMLKPVSTAALRQALE